MGMEEELAQEADRETLLDSFLSQSEPGPATTILLGWVRMRIRLIQEDGGTYFKEMILARPRVSRR